MLCTYFNKTKIGYLKGIRKSNVKGIMQRFTVKSKKK